MWPSGDVQKSKRLRREAGEWEEEAENELKQEVGRTSFSQALAEGKESANDHYYGCDGAGFKYSGCGGFSEGIGDVDCDELSTV